MKYEVKVWEIYIWGIGGLSFFFRGGGVNMSSAYMQKWLKWVMEL